jgi:precorrin-2 dehydrogenase/sirohydrochlorin ferrochelatase
VTVPQKRFFPAFLDLDRRPAVVIGDGAVAEKRARQLIRYGADVVVITPSPSPALIEAQGDGLLTIEARSYVRGDLKGSFVAICTSDDAEVRRAVFDEAESISCLVNIAGAPELCSFILPSVMHRGPLQIAISTGGGAPGVAKSLRQQLEADFGPEWAVWIALLGEVRAIAMEYLDDPAIQQRVMTDAAEPSVRERIAGGEELTAGALFAELAPEWVAAREAARAEAEVQARAEAEARSDSEIAAETAVDEPASDAVPEDASS